MSTKHEAGFSEKPSTKTVPWCKTYMIMIHDIFDTWCTTYMRPASVKSPAQRLFPGVIRHISDIYNINLCVNRISDILMTIVQKCVVDNMICWINRIAKLIILPSYLSIFFYWTGLRKTIPVLRKFKRRVFRHLAKAGSSIVTCAHCSSFGSISCSCGQIYLR